MSNATCMARTNYFQVRDLAAFKAALAKVPDIDLVEAHDSADGASRVAVLSACPDTGSWPSFLLDEQGEPTEDEVDIAGIIGEHLTQGSVAVVMEVGFDKTRYGFGWSVAVDHTGRRVQVSVDDIYDKARDAFGVQPPEAIY